MSILKPTKQADFSFQVVIRFERLETMGGNSANIVYRLTEVQGVKSPELGKEI